MKNEKKSARLVPRIWTQEQKLFRQQCCENWLYREETEGILNHIITGDESWVYEYDPCTKRLSMT